MLTAQGAIGWKTLRDQRYWDVLELLLIAV